MRHIRLRAMLGLAAAAALLTPSPRLAAQIVQGGNGAGGNGASGNGIEGRKGAEDRRGEGRRNGRMVRGSVINSAGANSVMIKTDAGEVWSVQTTENTRVVKDQQPFRLAEVKAGDEVMAFGLPDAPAHQLHAMMVGVVDAAVAAKARADLGKTYILGRITAINDTQLTVMRPDNTSQTITVDETTSFHRGGRMNLQGLGLGPGFGGGPGGGPRNGPPRNSPSTGPHADENGESITLADVKVGDTVGGTGSVKAGVFVPTDLRIQSRRPRGEDGGGSAGDPAALPPQ